MSLFEDTNPRDLKQLLDQIHRGDAVLPEFQRDFVWDPNATQELVVSIALNYPAGSLLRIRNTQSLFAFREFQGAPRTNGNRPTFLVLDGQQRLTSLYQAFFGVGDHRYYLNLQRLLAGHDFEECIFHLRSNHKKANEYTRGDAQARDLVLPLGVLKGGSGGFGRWSKNVVRRIEDRDERDKLDDALSDVEEKWIQTIDDYHFPVVTLSDSTSGEAVCTIFETLNRTGVKLTAFELLTARFWPKGVNLRELWTSAQEDHPILKEFAIDPYYILQIIALVSRPTPTCQRGAVLDLEADILGAWWNRVVAGMADGLRLLREDCGVLIPSWLPYNPLLLPLGAVLTTYDDVHGPEVGAIQQKLRRWFWCATLGQRYEAAANSQATKDFVELVRWIDGGVPPESVTLFRFDPRMLRDTTFRQRAVYRGTYALVFSGGQRDLAGRPRDFHEDKPITTELIREHGIDDHHIFPYAYLGRQQPPVPTRLRDSILNRTMIHPMTNKRISDRAPSVYLDVMREDLDPSQLRVILASHLLPVDDDSPLRMDDFERFIGWRENAIWEEIKRVTGLDHADELIEEEEAE